jgi:hypothetical protein
MGLAWGDVRPPRLAAAPRRRTAVLVDTSSSTFGGSPRSFSVEPRPRFSALYVLRRLVGDERPQAVVRFLLESRRVVLAQYDDVGGMRAVAHGSACRRPGLSGR